MAHTPKPQAEKFRHAARELEAEDEAVFDETLRRIVKTPSSSCEEPKAK